MARVTLRMIAREAKVSAASVSIALRTEGDGFVAKDKVRRIRAVAERLGYVPDPMLASLASRRFRSQGRDDGVPLALLEFPLFAGSTRSSFYREQIVGEARRLGYAPEVYPVREIGRHTDIARSLRQRGTQGVVITGQPPARFLEEGGRWAFFAMAQCGRYAADLPVHSVRPNISQAIHQVFDQVRRRGYRRIGFVLGYHPQALEDDISRQGVALALIERNIRPRDRVPPYRGLMHDPAAVRDWIRHHRADAYIGFHEGMWGSLREEGIDCPRDAGFAALHGCDGRRGSGGEPVMSGLNQCQAEIARQTVLLVDQMIRHGERGLAVQPRQLLISSRWVEGETLRPPEGGSEG